MNKRAKQTDPMTQLMLRRVLVLGMLIIALCVFDCTSSKVAGDIPFEYIVIDDQTWGIRSIGDIDGDGFADIVARAETGSGDHSLTWYEYPNWDQHVITDPESYRSCDIELADIDGDDMVWEREPLERLAKDGQLIAYRHTSFWQCMDTLREKCILESLWQSGKAPWKIWED